MMGFAVDDRVQIDIPDEDDPDFAFHGQCGTVVSLIEDDAASETGDPRDGTLFRVDLDDGPTLDFRWRDLRPAAGSS